MKKQIKKRYIALLSILLLGSSFTAYATNSSKSLEAQYDEKIRETQKIPDTYVVAHHIADFNSDGTEDLLLSTYLKGSNEIKNMIFTYKDDQMTKINEELSLFSGNHWMCTVSVVQSKNKKRTLIKTVTEQGNGGEGYDDTVYYKLDAENKMKEYLVENYFSDLASSGVVGEIEKYHCYGCEIDTADYTELTNRYDDGEELYIVEGVTFLGGPSISANADEYNSQSSYVEDEGDKYSINYR